jgi:hypothetical protein
MSGFAMGVAGSTDSWPGVFVEKPESQRGPLRASSKRPPASTTYSKQPVIRKVRHQQGG